MTSQRLTEILAVKRSLIDVCYGYDETTYAPFHLQGEEIEEMARMLLGLLDRNRRMATAILDGDSRAVFREYARQWLPRDEGGSQ